MSALCVSHMYSLSQDLARINSDFDINNVNGKKVIIHALVNVPESGCRQPRIWLLQKKQRL